MVLFGKIFCRVCKKHKPIMSCHACCVLFVALEVIKDYVRKRSNSNYVCGKLQSNKKMVLLCLQFCKQCCKVNRMHTYL